MKRDFKELSNELYDMVVIGGGITGACIAWDASLRGMKCLLLEKNDYSSATSQATSKLIHGGLRYLKNFEIAIVRESLREKRVLAKISPHSFRILPMMIPVYSVAEKLITGIGMKLANVISFDRNKDINSDLTVPGYIYLPSQNTVASEKDVKRNKLKGSFLYYDYSNFNPERLTCEFIFSARSNGAASINYMEVSHLEKEGEQFRVKAIDTLNKQEYTFKAKSVVNAGGPWADFIERMTGVSSHKALVRSKGIHIVTRKICSNNTVVTKKKDGTHIFIIPWRNRSIIGTTDTVYKEDPDHLVVTKQEILDLIDNVNFAYGSANLTIDDVYYTYAGLRPLVQDSQNTSKDTYSSSRKSEILDFKEFNYPGFFTAMGGKYTTSRYVAEQLVDRVAGYLKGDFRPCSTQTTPLKGGDYDTQDILIRELGKKFPKVPSIKLEFLASRYGTEAFTILEKYKPIEEYSLPNGEVFYSEEVEYICNREDVCSLSDFYFRRSGIGNIGSPNKEVSQKIADFVGKLLGWNEAQKKEELEKVNKRFLMGL